MKVYLAYTSSDGTISVDIDAETAMSLVAIIEDRIVDNANRHRFDELEQMLHARSELLKAIHESASKKIDKIIE